MKRIFPLLLCLCLLCGCSDINSETTELPDDQSSITTPQTPIIEHESKFTGETVITLSDDSITWSGEGSVSLSHDIIYYEDRDQYESGRAYGDGSGTDRHSADEAVAHTVVNITAPGTYRITGTLSAGQIRVDLGEDAKCDPGAVVELILDNADITCTVAPAILFLHVYECDGDRTEENATPYVDTADAGAVIILAEGSKNRINGSYVAKIYKDADGQKKLWKQDGALYSYMSLVISGSGTLDLTAENEGLGSEMHLTINGGNINIRSQDDGINTNEDGVSVTTINAGSVHIIAGLGEEGDGIDSNGYLVINGGTVVSSAHPAADAGLDSDLGSYANGGTVIALGSTMDWAESNSQQVTINLQFASYQDSNSAIVITRTDGGIIFAYDPCEDEVLGNNTRKYQGAVISTPNLQIGENYHIYVGGKVSGSEVGGVYLTETITGYADGVQQMYTGNDVGMMFPGGNFPGQFPDDFTPPGGNTEPPENGQFPGGGEPPQGGGFTPPDGDAQIPENGQFPGGGEPPQNGGFTPPDGDAQIPEYGQFPGNQTESQTGSTLFFMNDTVNAFSGVTAYVPADGEEK